MLQLSLMEFTYPANMRLLALLLLIPVVATSGEIYIRDGVTDGDTFYLAPSAFANDDAAFQSWVAYSLMKSACQLEIGGENPARANSFECEFKSRQHLSTPGKKNAHKTGPLPIRIWTHSVMSNTPASSPNTSQNTSVARIGICRRDCVSKSFVTGNVNIFAVTNRRPAS